MSKVIIIHSNSPGLRTSRKTTTDLITGQTKIVNVIISNERLPNPWPIIDRVKLSRLPSLRYAFPRPRYLGLLTNEFFENDVEYFVYWGLV